MASPPAYRRKLAFIIGINEYVQENDKLRFCINDARDLNKALQMIGFETVLGLDWNYERLLAEFNGFVEKIKHDDLVLFYFAGHGKQSEEENFLLPSDYDYDYLGHEYDYIVHHAINVKHIMKRIDGKKCRFIIYFFDCCRLKTKKKTRGPYDMSDGLAPVAPKQQTLVVFACAPGEATLDETWNNRNGSFVENLLKHITIPNKDIEDVIKKVARDVHRQTAGVQQPYRTTSLTSEVYLTDTECRKVNANVLVSVVNDRKWKQNGLTVCGGNGSGDKLNQLSWPEHLFIDDESQYTCIYIADRKNHRIVKWEFGKKMGEVVAGGNGQGNQMNQLFEPTHVFVDKNTNSLIICDNGNQRVIQWSQQSGTAEKTLIRDIHCSALTKDKKGDLYVSDYSENTVKRWRDERTPGAIVAGGNNVGFGLHQLHYPTDLFVDKEQSVYVTDTRNHRVVKWLKGAREGIVVAGWQGEGDGLTQLNLPQGMTVDHLGNVYVADSYNHRIVRCKKGSKEGHVIVGGNGEGGQTNQLSYPSSLSFDQHGHLYVVDAGNNRIQKFEVDYS